MKFFKHDTDSRTNRKLRKVLRTHGPTGYAIWWAVLEEMYQADDFGFQVKVDDLWLEGLAESLCISDYRTLIRVLDTFAEIGLIDSQLWQEHYIYSPAIKERGDEYTHKKTLNAIRQARFREKKKALEEDKRVSNALRNAKSNDVTPSDPDPDPDPDSDLLKRSRSSDLSQATGHAHRLEELTKGDGNGNGSVLPGSVVNEALNFAEKHSNSGKEKCSAGKAGKKLAKAERVYSRIQDRGGFEKFWAWYRKDVCPIKAKNRDRRAASPGKKVEAAAAWVELEELDFLGHGRDGFREGCRLQYLQYKSTGGFDIPHANRFLYPSQGEPEWFTRLEEQSSGDVEGGFLGCEGLERRSDDTGASSVVSRMMAASGMLEGS